jgi:hypothetical protein
MYGCVGSFQTCIAVKKTHCNFCEENTLILYIRVNLFHIKLINGMHTLVLNKKKK